MKKIILISFLFIYGSFAGLRSGTFGNQFIYKQPNHHPPENLVEQAKEIIRTGDIIVRMNNDPASYFIQNLNRNDKSYSHAGMAIVENGHPFVYHMVVDGKDPEEKMRRDSLRDFCHHRENSAFGIYRYNLSSAELTRIKNLTRYWFKKKLRFDTRFDWTSGEKMYCTEMVARLLTQSTGNRIEPATGTLTAAETRLAAMYFKIPLKQIQNLEIVPVESLYRNKNCQEIGRYTY